MNAVRTAHNMPAPEFMDLADEMGLLVVSEAFDMWELPKTPMITPGFSRNGPTGRAKLDHTGPEPPQPPDVEYRQWDPRYPRR